MTCFLCGGEITRKVINAKAKKRKRAFENVPGTIWVASVDARHTRAESAEGKRETMVGAKEITS